MPDDELVEMVVESVRVHMLSSRHVVILKETERDRYLPIWIGPWEASAIAMKLQGLTPERPLTHDLFATTLEDLGVASTGWSSPTSPRRRSTPAWCVARRRAGPSRWTPARPMRSRSRSAPGVRIFASAAVLDQAGLGADGALRRRARASAGDAARDDRRGAWSTRGSTCSATS